MADSQQVDRPAVVTQAKRNSYLRHVQIHMELLQESLTGGHFGCGVVKADREEIEKRLLDIWRIACAAELEIVEARPVAGDPPRSAQIIPFRRSG
jgi:hypothetical protein